MEGGRLVRESFTSKRNGKTVVGGKTKLTDAGTRVPLIASWPGVIPAGRQTDDLVDFTDFYATCIELGGGRATDRDGVSFAASLQGRANGRSFAFAEKGNSYFVRDQRYKLYGDGRFLDIEKDSEERRPLQVDGLAPAQRRAYEQLRKQAVQLDIPSR